jgi:hypothetical protein
MLRFPEYYVGGRLPSTTFELVNEGEGAWNGPIHARVPWLKITPNHGNLAPGERLVLSAEITPEIDNESGMLTSTKAIQIVGGSQNLVIGAWINVMSDAEPMPSSEPDPAPVSEPIPPAPDPFPSSPPSPPSISSVLSGVVVSPQSLNIDDTSLSATFRVSTALQRWQGRVSSNYDFLDVYPQEITVVGGAPQDITVNLDPDAAIPVGYHELGDAILIVGDDGLRVYVAVYLDFSDTDG